MAGVEGADGAVRSTRAVDRALVLLAAVTEGSTGGTLSELARAAGLSPSTAGRLLSTLAQHQLVRRDEGARYRPGSRMKQLAVATLRDEPLYELAEPHLAALADETGETASLGVAIDDDRVLYLRQVASQRLVQTAMWAGRTIPRAGTALGRALNGDATLPGYVASQRGDEITAVAAPVFDQTGQIIGAISINAPAYRTTADDIEAFGRALARHAAELSASCGAPTVITEVIGSNGRAGSEPNPAA
jgi:DNA-binding IclR family transcriptional regulator